MYYFSGNFTAFGYLKKGLTAVMFKQRVEAFEWVWIPPGRSGYIFDAESEGYPIYGIKKLWLGYYEKLCSVGGNINVKHGV